MLKIERLHVPQTQLLLAQLQVRIPHLDFTVQ